MATREGKTRDNHNDSITHVSAKRTSRTPVRRGLEATEYFQFKREKIKSMLFSGNRVTGLKVLSELQH